MIRLSGLILRPCAVIGKQGPMPQRGRMRSSSDRHHGRAWAEGEVNVALRPNGWQWLWIVVSILYLALVVTFAIRYWTIIQGESPATSWTILWRMALVWVVPCLTFYVLGSAAAWVWRLSGPRSLRADPRGPKGK